MRKSFVILSVLVLVGCISPEEIAARRDAREITECKKLGLKIGTDAFAQCRLQLRTIAAQEEGAAAAGAGAAQQNYWNTYNAVTRPYNR